MSRALLLLISVFVAMSVVGEQGPPRSPQLEEFVLGMEMADVTWSVSERGNYISYHGRGQARRAGAVTVDVSDRQLGFEIQVNDITYNGSIGRFPVKWFRRVIGDGSRQAETALRLDRNKWARILIEAPDEAGLSRYIHELGQLALLAPEKRPSTFVGPGFVDSGLATNPAASSAVGTN